MKKDWQTKKLSEVCKIQTGKWDANHAVKNGKFRFYTCAYKHSFCNTKRFSGECLILPGNGVNVGEVFYYNGEFDAYQRTYVISHIKTFPKFLFYHLFTFWKERNLNKQFGSATNFLKIGNFNNYKIPLPPLAEQKRIVGVLDGVFENIEKAKEDTEKNLKNAKELFQSYLQRVFENPKNDWQTKKLGEVLKLEYGKPLSRLKRINNGKYPVYGANGIKSFSNEFYFNKPSIIVGRKGSAGELNLTEKKFWPLDVTYFITSHEKNYNLKFLYNFLAVLNLPKLAKGVKPGINRNDIYSIEVNIPPLAEQKRIVGRLDALSEEVKKLEQVYQQKLDNLEELKKSILKQAFSGDL